MKTGAGDPEARADALAEFLAEHADHAKGFKTDYPGGLGSGRVAIKCKGCGVRIERTAEGTHELADEPLTLPPPAPRRLPARKRKPEPSSEPAVESPSRRDREPRPGPAPRPAPRGDRTRTRPAPPAAERPAGQRRRWVTIALAAIAAGSLLVAVLRLAGGDGSSDQAATPPAQPAPPAQSSPPGNEQSGPQQSQNDQGPEQASPAPAGGGESVSGPGYSLKLPTGWQKTVEDKAVVLAPRGSSEVELRLYYDGDSSLSLSQMVASTTELLRGDHPGAKISTPDSSKQGRAAVEAKYPGGSSEAAIIASGGTRLLLVSEIGEGASSADRAAAESVARSLEPH